MAPERAGVEERDGSGAAGGEGGPGGQGTRPPAGGRRRQRLLLATTVVLVVVGLLAALLVGDDPDGGRPSRPPATEPRPAPERRPADEAETRDPLPALGVYRGGRGIGEVDAYETWLGREMCFTLDFFGRGPNWSDIERPPPRLDQWVGSQYEVVYSVAMLPSGRYSLRAGAAGRYDDHWRRMGESFVARGHDDAILRLGWEFNGNFYPWAAGGREETYAAYWRRIVQVLRAVPGARFRFEWTALAGNANARVEDAYPGNAFVDYIGLDAYDTSSVTDSPEDRWEDLMRRPYGLGWHREFARAQGKPTAFSEWGLTERRRDDLGGGDNPYFIERMHEWLADSGAAYAIYFEDDARDAHHRLMTQQFRKSAAVYRRLFGGGGGQACPATGGRGRTAS